MITRRHVLLGCLALPLFGGLLGQAAFSQQYFTRDGVALRGYDPVAYFITGTPQSGDEAFAAEWGGTVWHFTSAQNRDLFLNAPESYAPQYGGYCAWAVSEGYTAPIDPDAWRIVEGKLYLNASRRIQNRWERDISGHIARADANWPVLRAGL